ncbi:hypothetical protein OP492_04310 [Pseudomonas mosselii]|uniref:hypothetical protein n=1 Tax=Pseudomonas mosselii TaxID=78327 RepID=UPI002B05D21E|nr:hypothetical protein [Pseudomonas mosselii]MEA3233873.1 hypothetical protein [Pseudomonas mosselii]
MSNVDVSFLQRELSRLKADREKRDNEFGGDDTGGGGGGSELEARVAKLESHVEYIRRDIADLKSDAKAISADVSSLKVSAKSVEVTLGHVDTHMVTKGKLALWALIGLATVVGSAFGVAWWLAQQYLGPILKSLPTIPQ